MRPGLVQRLGLGLAVAFVLVAAPASAYTLLGAEVLPVRNTALEVNAGWPEVRFGYHIPVLRTLQITPRGSFFYSGGAHMAGDTLGAGNFGMRFGADIKLRVADVGNWHMAVIWKFGAPLNFTPEFSGAVQLGLPGGFLADWEVATDVRLIFGLHFQSAVYIFDDGSDNRAVFNLPMVFEVGAEYALTSKFQLGFDLEVGPSFFFSSGTASGTQAYVAGLLSFQYLL